MDIVWKAPAPPMHAAAAWTRPARESHLSPEALPPPTRQRILDLLREDPGCPLGELKSKLGVGWGTLYYHVEMLEKAGLARTAVSGRRKLVFPGVAERDPLEVAGRNILVAPTARAIARALVARPGLDLQEVGRAAGQNPRVAYYHVRRLVAARLVSSASATRYADLQPTELLARLLREMDARGAEASCESYPPRLVPGTRARSRRQADSCETA